MAIYSLKGASLQILLTFLITILINIELQYVSFLIIFIFIPR